ncbi:MAG: radical SAM protein [Deltaproteobacteria bacterium]|nr:radical SAM protein [Deltaproteobacteria bacterium]
MTLWNRLLGNRPRRRHSHVVFEATTTCNHVCPHCYNAWEADETYPRGLLDTKRTCELLGKIIDETRLDLLSFSGGEPMLRKDFFELVDFVAGRGVAINLITNGSLLDRAAIDRIGPATVSLYELPLLGPNADIHDRMSGKQGAFDRVTRAIAELKDAGEDVVCAFVATNWNIDHWKDTAELAFALGTDGIMFNRFNPGGRGLQNLEELQVDPRRLTRALDQAQALTSELNLPISCSIPMQPCLLPHERWPDLDFGFCAAGTKNAYYAVDPLGNMRPCNHSPTILGNLLTSNFWDLVGSDEHKRFLTGHPAFCSGCRLEDECLGGCKAAAQVAFGDINHCDPFLSAYKDQARKLSKNAESD